MPNSPVRLLAIALAMGCAPSQGSTPSQGPEATTNPAQMVRVTQELVAPPMVPVHDQVAVGPPKIVQIRMVVAEKLVDVGPDGAKVWAMSFNGTVPGPLIVVHQNDQVELTLVNPAANTLVHNIDFHAATGALGGGGLTQIGPGQEVVLRFKATKAGLFAYHCAPGGPMIPFHVVSGMNGAIMVLPRDGLRDAEGKPVKYDRAYYVGEQDYYLPRDAKGKYRQYPVPGAGMADMINVMKTLTPTHVVFNGSVGALTGDAALTAKVGERVLFIHSQANRDTRPHLIGGHADLFWGGSFADRPATNLETWFIEGGSAGAMMYQFRQPGLYVYLNHNLIEAILLGAAAHVKVDGGEWNNELMEQVAKPGPIKSQ
jgi:nitrite reductase (NO-forming)